jgi:Ribbon-helix-helix protein, copG family
MATMTIRSTYALDVETVRKLEDLARRWGVSKSEALRRSVRAASETHTGVADRLQAFKQAQRAANLTITQARTINKRLRAIRHASSARRLS